MAHVSTPRSWRPACSSHNKSGQSTRQVSHSLYNTKPPVQHRQLLLSVYHPQHSTQFGGHSALLFSSGHPNSGKVLPLQRQSCESSTSANATSGHLQTSFNSSIQHNVTNVLCMQLTAKCMSPSAS